MFPNSPLHIMYWSLFEEQEDRIGGSFKALCPEWDFFLSFQSLAKLFVIEITFVIFF